MIDLVTHKLITGDGQVIVLDSQENNRKSSVLFVRVTANVLLPAYSEMEILADTGDFIQEDHPYMLEGVESSTSNVIW